MRSVIALITVATAVASASVLAQAASTPPDPGKSSGSSASESVGQSRYGKDDCRKDMENVRDARQAGHITDKEVTEQKKMAEAKLRRDAGQAGSAGKDIECR